MHPIQRALIGFLILDPKEPRPAPTGLMAVQGTPFFVPVLVGFDDVAARWPIGFTPDFTSGLVLGDLEQDDVLDLLAREGLGGVAEVVWNAGRHVGHVRVHAPSVDLALDRLAHALDHRMPGRYIPTATARAELARVSVNAPTDAEHAKAMVDWVGDDGDLQGSVIADRGEDWATSIVKALGEAAEVRKAARAIRAIRTAVAEGQEPTTWLEAGPLRLQLSLADYSPGAVTE